MRETVRWLIRWKYTLGAGRAAAAVPADVVLTAENPIVSDAALDDVKLPKLRVPQDVVPPEVAKR